MVKSRKTPNDESKTRFLFSFSGHGSCPILILWINITDILGIVDFKEIFGDIYLELPLFNTTKQHTRRSSRTSQP